MSLSSQKLYGSVLLSPHAKEYGFEFSSPTCYNEKSLKFPPFTVLGETCRLMTSTTHNKALVHCFDCWSAWI